MKETKIPEILESLTQAISAASGVTTEQINGDKRQPEIVAARHAIWYIAHDYMGFGFTSLARFLKRDHTTIMYGVEKIRKDEKTKDALVEGLRKINPKYLDKIVGNKRLLEDWKFNG